MRPWGAAVLVDLGSRRLMPEPVTASDDEVEDGFGVAQVAAMTRWRYPVGAGWLGTAEIWDAKVGAGAEVRDLGGAAPMAARMPRDECPIGGADGAYVVDDWSAHLCSHRIRDGLAVIGADDGVDDDAGNAYSCEAPAERQQGHPMGGPFSAGLSRKVVRASQPGPDGVRWVGLSTAVAGVHR